MTGQAQQHTTSKEHTPVTREEYIKVTGVSGDELIDDLDVARAAAKAGYEKREEAVVHKRAVDQELTRWTLGEDVDAYYAELKKSIDSNTFAGKELLRVIHKAYRIGTVMKKYSDQDEVKSSFERLVAQAPYMVAEGIKAEDEVAARYKIARDLRDKFGIKK